MKRFFILLSLLILAACTPASSEDLPTLARFPTETEAPPIVVNQTQAAQLRTPLPATFTPTASLTPIPPSATASITVTVSLTPSATITDTPSPTMTDLPPLGPEERPLLAFAMTAYAMTVLPPNYQVPPHVGANITLAPTQGTPNSSAIVIIGAQPTAPSSSGGTCSTLPTAGFLTIYQSNPDIAALLGCATGSIQTIPAASQSYQQGTMLWLNGEIAALYNLNDLFQTYSDTFVQGVDPETSSETPPSGLTAPMRGFLKVWSSNQTVRDNLGWGTGAEVGANATIQSFANGRMIYISGRSDVLVFLGLQTGTWLSFQGQY
jgi:hypothetical protein